jgi:hypothetical protein
MAFYAYMHARPGADAMGVFYVGKGRGRRSHDFRRRNPYHQHVIAKYGSANIDVARIECSDEASAFELERGGTSPSEETRAKLSAAVKEIWRKRKLATSGEQK